MIPDNSLLDIAQKLLAKSRSGKVLWHRTPNAKSSYSVDFPGSQLVIESVRPIAEPDYIRMSVVGPDFQELGYLVADEADERQSLWHLLCEIHAEAERRVTGWDKVLHEIEVQLDDQGLIGSRSEPETPNGVPF